jgi:hypothetical protein
MHAVEPQSFRMIFDALWEDAWMLPILSLFLKRASVGRRRMRVCVHVEILLLDLSLSLGPRRFQKAIS